jgi:hypothetical protein
MTEFVEFLIWMGYRNERGLNKRYSRKLWIEDFPKDVVYLPFE